MSIYVEPVEVLKNKIEANAANSVLEVWAVFKSFFINFNENKPQSVTNLGIMSEITLSTSPIFYFSLHYLVDDGECSYSEWVYCEFNLQNVNTSILNEACIELWDWDYQVPDMFQQIESWLVFQTVQDKALSLNVYGAES